MKNAFLWPSTVVVSLLLFFACAENTNETPDKDGKLLPSMEETYNEDENEALNLASEVALLGQQQLMATLVKALEDSGAVKAVVFCNVHVGGIYDSLKNNFGVNVQRVSHRNRNPANAANEREIKLINEYTASPKLSPIALFNDGDHYTAYKPIRMSILACSKCHGKPGEDIAEETFITINMLYPNDKAVDFKYKDMRGLWKIEIPKTKL